MGQTVPKISKSLCFFFSCVFQVTQAGRNFILRNPRKEREEAEERRRRVAQEEEERRNRMLEIERNRQQHRGK